MKQAIEILEKALSTEIGLANFAEQAGIPEVLEHWNNIHSIEYAIEVLRSHSSDEWKPTMNLRWRNRFTDTKNGEIDIRGTLEQEWVSKFGMSIWQEVKVVW